MVIRGRTDLVLKPKARELNPSAVSYLNLRMPHRHNLTAGFKIMT